MMPAGNLLPQRLGTTPPWPDPWRRRHEGAPTIHAPIALRTHFNLTLPSADPKMSGFSPIDALAAEAAASAARASKPLSHLRSQRELKANFGVFFMLDSERPIALSRHSVIHRGHDGGFSRLMSPFFDGEPILR